MISLLLIVFRRNYEKLITIYIPPAYRLQVKPPSHLLTVVAYACMFLLTEKETAVMVPVQSILLIPLRGKL